MERTVRLRGYKHIFEIIPQSICVFVIFLRFKIFIPFIRVNKEI